MMKFTPTLFIIFFPRPRYPVRERNEVNLTGITFSEPSLPLPAALFTNTKEEAARVMLEDSVLDNVPFNYFKVFWLRTRKSPLRSFIQVTFQGPTHK